VNRTLVGQAVNADREPLTSLATNVQHKLSAEYQSPFSVAVGASRTFGATRLHISAEWFKSVSLYQVVAAEPFEAQSSGETIDPAIYQDLDSVTNVAVAAEHAFETGTRIYLGFHTDFSGASRDPAANLTLSKWDMYHVSGGTTFQLKGTDLTLGADVGFASDTINSDLGDPFRPITLPDNTNVRFTRIIVILGFNFAF
jgi:hypothetical protein